MQTSPTIGAIATALAEAQKNFAPIPKDREVTVRMKSGGSYKFKYATLDAIRSATMPALAAQGLAVSQGLSDDYKGLETAVYHTSGEWLKNVTPMMIDGERSNQAMGSAQSYARRYGLSSILCVTADEDDDANAADGNHVESATGTAAAGGDFRPDGPRRMPYSTPQATAEAQRDGLTANAPAKPAPGVAAPRSAPATNGDALKRIQWVRDSIAGFVDIGTTDALSAWWRENRERRDVIETALPTEYDKLIDAYDNRFDALKALVS